MSFKIGSLFSGSGGFELAATMCGGIPVWASEVEPFPIAVTKSRFPNMKHLGSVTEVKGNEVEPVDVITFGSPCQDLSVAGKRAGLKHEDNGDEETTRSGLFMEAVRIIKEMREATNGVYPRFAIWENVPGAFSSNKGEDFRTVCEELIKIVEPGATMPAVPKNGWPYADCYCGDGWSLAYRVYDAQYWGVPQRRRRIYLVADFGGECAGQVSFEREGLRGYFAEGRTPGKRTAADAESCPGADDREGKSIGYGGGQEPDTLSFQWQAGAEASLCIGEDLGPSLSCTRVPAVAFHLLQDPIPNNKVSPCMGQGNSDGGQASIGVAIGFDSYNLCTTGNVGRTVTTPSGGLNEHIPCVVEAIGIDRYNQSVTGKVSETLRTPGGGDNYPTVVCCIDGDKIGKAERSGGSGLGIRDGDKMHTLTAKDAGQHSVAYCTDVGWLNTVEGQAPTLLARQYKDPHLVCYWDGGQTAGTLTANNAGGNQRMPDKENFNAVIECRPRRYIVRRLTPTECARLQGFADAWAVPDSKDDFTDEEYRFWLTVRNTHAEINGKVVKEYTKAQMLTWYNKLRTDGSEYKLWGNGIALPCALYVMQGIADVLNQ